MRKIYASFILFLLLLCSCSDSSTVTPENCTHNFQAVAIIKQATCTENGSGKVICTRCGKEDVQELHSIGHVERTLSYVAPTCTSSGLEAGSVCNICNTVLIPQKEIPKLSHVEEIMPAVQATCSREGLTEGKRCSLCKVEFVPQTLIPKLSHVEEEVLAAIPATCTESGSTAMIRCSLCKQTIKAQQTISAKGHTTNYGTCQRCFEVIGADNSNREVNNTSKPTEKEYTTFVCDYYNKLLDSSLQYMTYSLDKHVYQIHLGLQLLDSYKYLAGNDIYSSLTMHMEVYNGLYNTYLDLNKQLMEESEFTYGYQMTVEVWAPNDAEILFIASEGKGVYCAYFEFVPE